MCGEKRLTNKYVMCPKMYSPVCAVYNTKAKQELNKINSEFSNGCWACQDKDVYGNYNYNNNKM